MEVGAGREEGEAAAAVATEVAPVAGRRGCIRSTQGPWTVRRRGRGGGLTTSLRHPTLLERENNRQRERRRRQVAAKIYAGLRAHAGYTLPKHADQNDVLRALCAEAGYHVDDDGNVTRLQVPVPPSPPGNKSSAVTAEDLFPLTDVRFPLAWDPLMLRSRFLFSTNGERTSCLHCVLAMCMYSTHPLARRQIFFTPRYKKNSAGILLVTNYMVD